ncbi:MAG: hypothetical protein IIZ33_04180, partial [Erysipelotrichaceae bacterium]|nr:hypothetical protein [Erysipelotrichaceae bacterium]
TYGIYLLHYPVYYLFKSAALTPWLSIPFTIILTLLLTAVLRIPFISLKKKNGRILQIVLSCLLLVIGVFGGYKVFSVEDYSEEAAELEAKLEENRKLIEERNQEIERSEEEERQAYEDLFESGKSDEEAVAEWMERLPIIGIGDSIMLDAVKTLYSYFPQGYFDCEISRSLYYGEKVLTQLKEEGKLSEPIVLCLGTNGNFSKKRSEELLDITGDMEIFWVNAVGADDPTYNRKFEDFAKDHPNIHIIHWEEISKGHPEYFYYDGIHVVGDGVKAFSKAIYDAVYERYLVKFKEDREKMKNGMADEAKAEITFYGNDALVSVYPELSSHYESAVFHTDIEDYDDLYQRMEEEKKKSGLPGRTIFLFDKSAGIKESQYKKLNGLCEGEIIVVSLQKGLSIEGDGIRTLDFYEEIRKNPSYLIGDKKHLSEEGAKALSEKILASIQ